MRIWGDYYMHSNVQPTQLDAHSVAYCTPVKWQSGWVMCGMQQGAAGSSREVIRNRQRISRWEGPHWWLYKYCKIRGNVHDQPSRSLSTRPHSFPLTHVIYTPVSNVQCSLCVQTYMHGHGHGQCFFFLFIIVVVAARFYFCSPV